MNPDTLKENELDTFSKLEQQVDRLLSECTPQTHESIFTKFLISNEHRKTFIEENLSSVKNSCSTFQTNGKSAHGTPAIPKLINRLWLTNSNEPSLPPEDYLKRISNQVERLQGEYSFIFWHNSELVIPALEQYFGKGDIEFRNIASLTCDPRISDRIQRAISAKKYVMGGDISKFAILKEIGGVYADLGVDFKKPLLDLVQCSDMSLFLDGNLFFQPAFMAAPPNFEPLQIWGHLLSRPEVLTSIALPNSPALNAGHEIWMHGGVGFTAILMLFYDSSYNILPVPPNRGSLHHESQGSWYRAGNKYGNATLETATVTHLDWEIHSQYVRLNQEIDAGLASHPALFRLRARIARHLQDCFWLR
jgi:hypothetical protein